MVACDSVCTCVCVFMIRMCVCGVGGWVGMCVGFSVYVGVGDWVGMSVYAYVWVGVWVSMCAVNLGYTCD